MPKYISDEQLKLYFNGEKTHPAYAITKKKYEHFKTHADGKVPVILIHERRPSESLETLEYRKKIYVPKTKNPVSKVVQSLSKIRRSPDWSIRYDPKAVPSRIVPEESLEEYCERKFPGHQSVTNWVFSHLLKTQAVDPNAVVAVLPVEIVQSESDYYRPVAMIFNSDQVIYFKEGSMYAILESRQKASQEVGNSAQEGKIFYYLSDSEVIKYEETKPGTFTPTLELTHDLKDLPVFKLRAQFDCNVDSTTVNESRLSAMLPSLDEAAREYSDLQAAKVQHMFPLFWYYQDKDCNDCNGTGKKATDNGPKSCTSCGGGGKVKFSPYAHLAIKPTGIENQAAPIPPAGYISRDVEIIKVQEESVKNHLFESLAAINMQFLDQTPLNISGEAKNVDREELNNFVYNFAEDLVAAMDRVYHFINEWRYSIIVPDSAARRKMLPAIAVPQNFDLLPSDYLMADLGQARQHKANPFLIAALEQQIAAKKLYNDDELSRAIDLYFRLDPLPGISVDEKMTLSSNKAITQEDFVISSYCAAFVRKALQEKKDFEKMTYAEQMQVLNTYAKEKIKANDQAAKLLQEMRLPFDGNQPTE